MYNFSYQTTGTGQLYTLSVKGVWKFSLKPAAPVVNCTRFQDRPVHIQVLLASAVIYYFTGLEVQPSVITKLI